MRKIVLVGHANYMRTGCPTLFQRDVAVNVDDVLFEALLEEVDTSGKPVFISWSSGSEVTPDASTPEKAPQEPEKAPVNVTLMSGEIDTAMDLKPASKKRFVVGQKGGGQIAV